jgi:predicted dehydrogenase
MSQRIRWGVLGTAKIATTKVIPAMQQCEHAEITAIASRELSKAQDAAAKLSIPRSYGSYEALLADPDIDAVYIPLPNHLHVPMSIQAAEAGKHVLCEKPVALSVAECRTLIDAQRRTGVKIGEAFMVRSHPQWLTVRALIGEGEIGEVRSIMVNFSYFNRDPHNVRNRLDWGGGALMDIGCYAIQVSRFSLGQEPLRVAGRIDRDPEFGTDRLTSALIEFPHSHLLFTCSTQMVPAQRVQIFGTTGRIEVEIPFNAPNDRPTRIFLDRAGKGSTTHEFPVCDQYTLQGDAFSLAIIHDQEPPTPLSDSIRNMAVIDAVFRSAETGALATPEVK